MVEKNVEILVVIGFTLIFVGLIIQFKEAQKESYCNSLELREYFENKECRRIIER